MHMRHSRVEWNGLGEGGRESPSGNKWLSKNDHREPRKDVISGNTVFINFRRVGTVVMKRNSKQGHVVIVFEVIKINQLYMTQAAKKLLYNGLNAAYLQYIILKHLILSSGSIFSRFGRLTFGVMIGILQTNISPTPTC